jgi:hypothetical protein
MRPRGHTVRVDQRSRVVFDTRATGMPPISGAFIGGATLDDSPGTLEASLPAATHGQMSPIMPLWTAVIDRQNSETRV